MSVRHGGYPTEQSARRPRLASEILLENLNSALLPPISFVIGLTIRNTAGALANRRAGSSEHCLDDQAVRCLSVHARYLCAHAGECCRAGWAIPVEEPLIGPLRALGIRHRRGPSRACGVPTATARSSKRTPDVCAPSIAAVDLAPAVRVPPLSARRRQRSAGNLRDAVPLLPTAAGLLFDGAARHRRGAPVARARWRSRGTGCHGRPATASRPGSPDRLGRLYGVGRRSRGPLRYDRLEPEGAVEALTLATEAICSWRPGRETLTGAVRVAFANSTTVTRDGHRWGNCGRTVNAFLAAHAFASWAAYEPDGLRAIPAAVAEALAILRRYLTPRADRGHVDRRDSRDRPAAAARGGRSRGSPVNFGDRDPSYSRVKLIVSTMITGFGTPFSSVGVNSH